jgi:hypothetical protein
LEVSEEIKDRRSESNQMGSRPNQKQKQTRSKKEPERYKFFDLFK